MCQVGPPERRRHRFPWRALLTQQTAGGAHFTLSRLPNASQSVQPVPVPCAAAAVLHPQPQKPPREHAAAAQLALRCPTLLGACLTHAAQPLTCVGAHGWPACAAAAAPCASAAAQSGGSARSRPPTAQPLRTSSVGLTPMEEDRVIAAPHPLRRARHTAAAPFWRRGGSTARGMRRGARASAEKRALVSAGARVPRPRRHISTRLRPEDAATRLPGL